MNTEAATYAQARLGVVLRHVFLGGGFKYFLSSPLFGEDFPFD